MWHAGSRCQRAGVVHLDFPRVLCRPLAAYPLRGLPQSGGRHQRGQQGGDLTDRVAQATNDLVYATAGYEASVRNAAGVTLASDGIFSDGSSLQLATMSGGVNQGYTATLSIAVAV
jgi:hypothetical protein